MALTVLPLIFTTSPYDTPLTPLARAFSLTCFAILCKILDGVQLVCRSFRTLHVVSVFVAWDSPKRTLRNLGRTRKAALDSMSRSPSAKMAEHALRFILKMLDEPLEVEEFLAGLPAFLRSNFVGKNAPNAVLRCMRGDNCRLLKYVTVVLRTCHSSDQLLTTTRTIRRLDVCMNVLQDILAYLIWSSEARLSLENQSQSLEALAYLYVAEGIDEVVSLCHHPDASIAVAAACSLGRLRYFVIESFARVVHGSGLQIVSAPDVFALEPAPRGLVQRLGHFVTISDVLSQ
ncbi:hypothetical protein OF83DRAFT_1177275 [Amylostereum chailletii]|nr:hypothetical protein OF83DRAFT_1177275 [Amylostereum chailletii]